MTYDYIQDLLNFIHHSPSPYHTVQASRDYLDRAGFQALSLSEAWQLAPNGAYYVPLYDSGLIAFRTGSDVGPGRWFCKRRDFARRCKFRLLQCKAFKTGDGKSYL